jgi:hypothetical protein
MARICGLPHLRVENKRKTSCTRHFGTTVDCDTWRGAPPAPARWHNLYLSNASLSPLLSRGSRKAAVRRGKTGGSCSKWTRRRGYDPPTPRFENDCEGPSLTGAGILSYLSQLYLTFPLRVLYAGKAILPPSAPRPQREPLAQPGAAHRRQRQVDIIPGGGGHAGRPAAGVRRKGAGARPRETRIRRPRWAELTVSR